MVKKCIHGGGCIPGYSHQYDHVDEWRVILENKLLPKKLKQKPREAIKKYMIGHTKDIYKILKISLNKEYKKHEKDFKDEILLGIALYILSNWNSNKPSKTNLSKLSVGFKKDALRGANKALKKHNVYYEFYKNKETPKHIKKKKLITTKALKHQIKLLTK